MSKDGGKMIAYFCGVWDCVHAGHVIVLNKAKEFNMDLIVGVCSDKLNEHLKGRLPLFNAEERCRLLDWLGFKTKVYDNTDYHTHCYFDCFFHGPDFGQRKDQKEFLDWCLKKQKIIICLSRIPDDVNISTSEIIRRANAS
jgi:cytidyltransferase-like protein